MGLLKDKDRDRLRQVFSQMGNRVNLVFFSQSMECMYCRETRSLLTEISDLSDKIHLEVFDFGKDTDIAKKYKVDKIPATIVMGENDYGIRFLGIPSGHEFTTLIDVIMHVSRRDPGFSPETVKLISQIKQPIHLQVMISPTWI